jgi:hypothetical protein
MSLPAASSEGVEPGRVQTKVAVALLATGPFTDEEWSRAELRNTQAKDSQPTDCEVRVQEDWVRVVCLGEVLGHELAQNIGVEGKAYFFRINQASQATLTLQMEPGPNQTIRICRRAERASLLISWRKGSPTPRHVALGVGPVCDGSDWGAFAVANTQSQAPSSPSPDQHKVSSNPTVGKCFRCFQMPASESATSANCVTQVGQEEWESFIGLGVTVIAPPEKRTSFVSHADLANVWIQAQKLTIEGQTSVPTACPMNGRATGSRLLINHREPWNVDCVTRERA